MGRFMRVHPIDDSLGKLGPSASPESRLDVIWTAFQEATGTQLTSPPTTDERTYVLRWLREQRRLDDVPMLIGRNIVSFPAAHQTVAEKAGMLSSFGCSYCSSIEEDGELNIRFGLDVEPWAAQSRRDKVKIRETVKRNMEARGIYEPTSAKVCITVVSLTKCDSPIKDCDNLVKGLLDSFEGLIYLNDRQIQCLSARRVAYRGPRGAYFVMARAVRDWDCDVVMDDGRPPIIN